MPEKHTLELILDVLQRQVSSTIISSKVQDLQVFTLFKTVGGTTFR